MCAWQAAPFLWQRDGFSSRDAHGFNRYSSSQVTRCVRGRDFPLVSRGFSVALSLRLPSFHEAPRLVLFPFIGDKSWRESSEYINAPIRRLPDRERKPTQKRSREGCRSAACRCPPDWSAAGAPGNLCESIQKMGLWDSRTFGPTIQASSPAPGVEEGCLALERPKNF